jgi:hypothetical protein
VGARLRFDDRVTARLVRRARFPVAQLDLPESLLDDPDEVTVDLAAFAIGEQREVLGDGVTVIVGLPPLPHGAWSPSAEVLLALCRRLGDAGVALIRLTGAADLEMADRVRTEARVATCLDVGTGWATRGPLEDRSPWPEQIHVPVLAGRLDLVAGWPLSSATWEAAGPAVPPVVATPDPQPAAALAASPESRSR